MVYDIHVHIAGSGAGGSGNFMAPAFKRRLAFRLLARRFGLSADAWGLPEADQQLRDRLLSWLDSSDVDKAVLLAFDAPHKHDGTRDEGRTLMVTSNDFLADIADVHPKVLFGASVHPYRIDALEELERVIARGACLVKWLPGAQNIQPDDPVCFPFYEILAKHRVPLLSHTGVEHFIGTYPNSLNDPRRLSPALERGVTVIAAHCATRMMFHEKSWFGDWCEMALRHDAFYGDISAFGSPLRAWTLRGLVRNPRLAAKLVYGSDIPMMAIPLSFVGLVGVRRLLELRRIKNPFDQAAQLMRAAGVPNEVFSRAGSLLRI